MRNVLIANCYFYLCLALFYNNTLTDYILLFATVSRYMVLRGEGKPAVIPDDQRNVRKSSMI